MISSRNNTSVLNYSIFSGGKMNLIGALERSNSPIVFKSTRKNKKIIKEKQKFSQKYGFWCNFKKNYYMKFSC